jgi:hypothetical protein
MPVKVKRHSQKTLLYMAQKQIANEKEALDFTEKISNEIKDYESFKNYFAKRTWKDLVECKGLEDFDVSQEKRKFLFTLYLEWCELPDSLDTIVFCTTFRLHRQWLYDLATKYTECKNLFEMGRLTIAGKRRTENYKKKLSDTVYKDMYLYDSEWREVEKFHASLRSETPGNVPLKLYFNNVEQTNIPHSDDKPVPEETTLTDLGADE